MRLWDISIRHPVFMTMILVAGIVLGAVAYTNMPLDLFPDVEFPVVVVNTIYPGASPQEVEEQITSLLEESLSGVTGLDEISSISAESVSTVILLFKLDTSATQAVQDVRDAMSLLRGQLPDDIEEPIIRRFNPTAAPIMLLAVADRSGALSPVELRDKVEEFVQAPLLRVDGVAEVGVDGGQVREIKVNLDKEALEARRITPQEVVGALKAENLTIPAGSVVDGQRELFVRTPSEFQTVADLEDVIVRQGPSPVYLRDIAAVEDDFVDRDVITRLNGEESIVLSVRKASGTNTVAVSNAVQHELEHIRTANPDWEIVIGGDLATQVKQSADGAVEDLLWAMALASLIIWLFFRDLRSTLITIAGLPVIMVATLFFMNLFGIGLNQLSLLALALVVGLVVDDAIVVRENIMRWIERGYKPREAASRATAEVLLPVIATSATIVAVFLPVAYAQGIIGRFFRDFGLTVAIAIIVSTFESLTMAPMLSAYFFKPKQAGDRPVDDSLAQETAGRSFFDRFYARSLRFALRHKWVVGVASLIVIVASVLSVRFIQQSFIPKIDQGQFEVDMEMPPGTPLAVTAREAAKVEQILLSHPEVEAVFSTIGTPSNPGRVAFVVTVVGGVEGDASSRAIIDQLREPLAQAPGVSFQISDNLTGGDALLGNRDILIELVARAGSYDDLGQEAQKLAEQIKSIPGLTDIEVGYKPGQPEAQLAIDRQRAADFGLSAAQIGSTVRTLVRGEVASRFRGEGSEADIRVQLRPEDRTNIEQILDTHLVTPAGQLIPVRTVAEAVFASGPTQIRRVDRQPTISVGMNVVGRDLPDATADVTRFLQSVELPSNVEAKLGGDAEVQAESFRNLSLALLLSIIFIYMVLASQFGSFVQPILIMLAMPLSVVGAILALVLTGRPLDLTAFIGFIMLMGLVTKNSILLVDFANKARAKGATADEAMRIAGPIRLRPILMTTFSTILGMVPVALALGAAGEFRSPMGTAIIGGIITSTLLTLMVVPVAYGLVVGWQDRVAARRAERERRREALRSDEQLPPPSGHAQPVGD